MKILNQPKGVLEYLYRPPLNQALTIELISISPSHSKFEAFIGMFSYLFFLFMYKFFESDLYQYSF